MPCEKTIYMDPILCCRHLANSCFRRRSMAWFGYDQGVFSGVLISDDFINHFPQTKNANISGITSSCFSVSVFNAQIVTASLLTR